MDSTTEPKVRVALTFDFDAVSAWVQMNPSSPSFVSRGEFGRIGAERVRRILSGFGIKGTFFTPGHTALLYPDEVNSLVADGHELGHHGWVHEPLSGLSPQEERHALERGLEALDSVAGIRPVGYRAPGWDLSTRSVDLLVEYGFSYDSSMMGSDFNPYWCRTGDVLSGDGPFRFGEAADLVELPIAWHLDDVTFFEFVPGRESNLSAQRLPREVLEIWKSEFLYLHEEVGEGCLTLTLHPQCIGRGHRIGILSEFIEHVLSHDSAAFFTAREVVDEWRLRANAPSVTLGAATGDGRGAAGGA